MAFTAQDVAKLRETTGAGMMDCKKALTHTGGDMEKAAEYLREQGVAVAKKKESRIASEGVVAAYVSKDKKTGALIEINCESDFVAKAEPFVELANIIAEVAAESNPKDLDELSAAQYKGESVSALIVAATAKIGEKLALRRFVRFHGDKSFNEFYLHMGGKIGVLLEVETGSDLSKNEEFSVFCHDIAMQIAAASPKYIYESEVPAEESEHEKSILKAQALNEGKPADVVDKMIVGRIKKYYKEICLIEQEFVKDSSLTVKQVVADAAKKFGANIRLSRFARLTMGEGLEKKVDNLAEEVAKLQK